MSYPTTVEEMRDRLLADRAFLIRQVVNDNYPAVRRNFEEQLQSSQPGLIDTPEKLATELIWWDTNQGGPDAIDPVLAVPFRGETGSAILAQAMAQLFEIQQQTAGSDKFLIGSIIGAVNALAGSNLQADAARAEAQRLAAEAAKAEADRKAANARLLRWGVGIVVLLVVALTIWYFKRK